MIHRIHRENSWLGALDDFRKWPLHGFTIEQVATEAGLGSVAVMTDLP